MDKLKTYFRENEASLQVEEPDEKRLWERIEAGGTKKTATQKRTLVIRYVAAACVILLAGLGWMLFRKGNNYRVQPPVIAKISPPVANDTALVNPPPVAVKTPATIKNRDLPDMQPEDEAEKIGQSYAHIINVQINRLRATAIYTESPGYFTGFKQQLYQMDKDEALLRSDIKRYGLNDELLEQLINVYQQKLNLLKTLQTAINKMNNKVKEKQRSPGQVYLYHINI